MIWVNPDVVMDALRRGGMRVTPQRMAIAEYMGATTSHPSAEEVHRAVRERHPMVSLSTVYKTLEMLRDQGLLSEIEMGSGSRYDGRNTTHINLVCMECGRIDDLEGDFVGDLYRHVAESSEYEVGGCLDLRGRCGSCRQNAG